MPLLVDVTEYNIPGYAKALSDFRLLYAPLQKSKDLLFDNFTFLERALPSSFQSNRSKAIPSRGDTYPEAIGDLIGLQMGDTLELLTQLFALFRFVGRAACIATVGIIAPVSAAPHFHATPQTCSHAMLLAPFLAHTLSAVYAPFFVALLLPA